MVCIATIYCQWPLSLRQMSCMYSTVVVSLFTLDTILVTEQEAIQVLIVRIWIYEFVWSVQKLETQS